MFSLNKPIMPSPIVTGAYAALVARAERAQAAAEHELVIDFFELVAGEHVPVELVECRTRVGADKPSHEGRGVLSQRTRTTESVMARGGYMVLWV